MRLTKAWIYRAWTSGVMARAERRRALCASGYLVSNTEHVAEHPEPWHGCATKWGQRPSCRRADLPFVGVCRHAGSGRTCPFEDWRCAPTLAQGGRRHLSAGSRRDRQRRRTFTPCWRQPSGRVSGVGPHRPVGLRRRRLSGMGDARYRRQRAGSATRWASACVPDETVNVEEGLLDVINRGLAALRDHPLSAAG